MLLVTQKEKKKKGRNPPFFLKILNKKLIMPTTPGTKKNKQQSSLSFSARHYSHKPGPILAVTCVYFLFKCWLIIHTFFVCFFFFFCIQSNKIKKNTYNSKLVVQSFDFVSDRVLFCSSVDLEKKKVITHSSRAPSAFFGVCCCCSLSFVALLLLLLLLHLWLWCFSWT